MSAMASPAAGRGTFPRGIHPPECKQLSDKVQIEVLPTPKQVKIPLLQHTGAPNEAVVKPRTEVALGDLLGSSEAFVSAPVHASIAGKTAKVSVATLPNGRHVPAIPVKAAGDQLEGEALREEIFGGPWPKDVAGHDPGAIVDAARQAGLVGLGGAAFPTHVKLKRNADKPIDTLLVNGCECEPYLNADNRLMVEAADAVVTGALLAGRACGADQVLLAIEDNKPEAIAAARTAAEGTRARVVEVRTKYPQGGEKQLILSALARIVPTGGLPLDVGVVVMNVGTAAALARAVLRGRPLTHRVVSVTGRGITRPTNILAPIGASYAELIDFAGGLRPDAGRVIAGGPMMGFALGNLDTPVTKGTSGIVVLTEEEVRRREETSCVRCGRCVDVCPLHLVPTKIALACRHKNWEVARRYHMTACMECGCCAYACPAGIPLVQLIRMGKATAPRS
ncbi:MAG: electron transport complex subunit RsxC [Acidobacteriota bacterium]|nr:electron transport complex subunit RsxC [Acidobacteriota bacterium]